MSPIARAVGVLVAAAALVLAGCSTGHGTVLGGRLVVPGTTDSSAAELANDIPIERPHTFYVGSLCTTGSALAIRRVELVRPTHGLRLIDWAIRQRVGGTPIGNGDQAGRATDLPGFTHDAESVTCSNSRYASDFEVTLQAADPRPSTTHGFRITYGAASASGESIGSAVGHVTDPFTLTVCRHTCPDDAGIIGHG